MKYVYLDEEYAKSSPDILEKPKSKPKLGCQVQIDKKTCGFGDFVELVLFQRYSKNSVSHIVRLRLELSMKIIIL